MNSLTDYFSYLFYSFNFATSSTRIGPTFILRIYGVLNNILHYLLLMIYLISSKSARGLAAIVPSYVRFSHIDDAYMISFCL